VFFFFFANLSFYLVMTMFMQRGLHIPPLQAGMVFLPLALAFVVASRHSGARARHRGTLVLIEGCAVQMIGLASLVLMVAWAQTPSATLLALVLAIFGYGQGTGDGGVVQRRTFHRKSGKRRLGRGDVWHDRANRQRRRRCRHRRGVFCDRSRLFGAAGTVRRGGAVYAVDCRLRRVFVMDATRRGVNAIKVDCHNPGD
jgi:hypothetical protein